MTFGARARDTRSAATLVVADDEQADQIFAGRFEAAIREVPEPDPERICGSVASVFAELGDGVELAVTLKSKFCRPNLDRYAELLRGSADVSAAVVASVEDGIQLRLSGVTQRIVLLYVSAPSLAPLCERFRLEPGVASSWWLTEVHKGTTNPVPMHLWVDTGFGREGVLPDEAAEIAGQIRPGAFAGLATHLASVPYRYPDGTLEDGVVSSPEFAAEQLGRFRHVDATLAASGLEPARRHVANSGAVQGQMRQAYFEMVRPGRALVEQLTRGRTRRSLAVRTRVNHAQVASVKVLPAGWSCGYFSGKRLADPMRVAILTSGAGTLFSKGSISVVTSGRRQNLPIEIAHGGMCVVRADDVSIQPGDRVDLNHPTGLWREFHVPLSAGFDGRLYDPLRDRVLEMSLSKRLMIRTRRPDRSLLATADLSRYSMRKQGGAP